MKEYRLFPHGSLGCIFGVMSIALAICLTVATVNYQPPSDTFCRGRLSAGFPAAFICDASGESPLSSVGKIDWADLDSVSFPGSFLDILFYMALLWIAWLAIRGFSHAVRNRSKAR